VRPNLGVDGRGVVAGRQRSDDVQQLNHLGEFVACLALAALTGRDLPGMNYASDDEDQRGQIEESDPTDQRVHGGCTDQDESDYESRSPPRPSDDRNTADECRSDDDDCFGIVNLEHTSDEHETDANGDPTSDPHGVHRGPLLVILVPRVPGPAMVDAGDYSETYI